MDAVRSDGDCYQAALMVVTIDGAMPNHLVCHGTVTGRGPVAGQRFGHAWIEDRDGRFAFDFSNGLAVVADRDAYYRLGQIDPKEVRRYTDEEAGRLAYITGTYGPWEDSQEDQ